MSASPPAHPDRSHQDLATGQQALERRGSASPVRSALQRPAVRGPAGASRSTSDAQRGAALHPALDQDRRLFGDCSDRSSPPATRRTWRPPSPSMSKEMMEEAQTGRRRHRLDPASAWGPHGARGRQTATSSGCSTSCATCRPWASEACCHAGLLTRGSGRELKDAGLDAYNHNIDTSPEAYAKSSPPARMTTVSNAGNVRDAGMPVCCGGILGLGESRDDRYEMLAHLAGFDPHPESVPINYLVPMPGTPLHGTEPARPARFRPHHRLTRIAMPKAMSPPLRGAPGGCPKRRRRSATLPVRTRSSTATAAHHRQSRTGNAISGCSSRWGLRRCKAGHVHADDHPPRGQRQGSTPALG